MSGKYKVIYTPFDGKKQSFGSIREACRVLEINPGAVHSKFKRQEKAGKDCVHLFEHGKLEKA